MVNNIPNVEEKNTHISQGDVVAWRHLMRIGGHNRIVEFNAGVRRVDGDYLYVTHYGKEKRILKAMVRAINHG